VAEIGGLLAILAPLREHHEPTYLHAMNVALLCAALSRALKASPDMTRDVVQGGLLHDIGKLAVPAEVLGKTEPLMPDEERAYQGHCFAGATLLAERSGISSLAAVAAYEHHFFSQGGGFPETRGRRKPHLVSQVVGLANFYDARRCGRPNRPARDVRGVFEEIVRETPRRFHPNLVAALPRALQDYETIPGC
jgi:HD-GYP domain-containing protein (c-di-GMP phosphodiesterase class II)